ncbi:MAG TPA: NUDIX hydrolase [bacterium]|nr:NUDIX hydrolase [bacterium]
MPGSVLPWVRVGRPAVLVEKFGKSVVSQTFRNPRTGIDAEYILFGHADWSTVVPITTDGFVIAVEQYKQGCDRIVLELPGGVAEAGDEDADAAAARELLEETGYRPQQVTSLGPALFMNTRNSWTKCHPFLATGCRPVQPPSFDEHEDLLTRMFALDEWVRLCVEELVSPSTIATTFRALPHLGYRFVKGGAG